MGEPFPVPRGQELYILFETKYESLSRSVPSRHLAVSGQVGPVVDLTGLETTVVPKLFPFSLQSGSVQTSEGCKVTVHSPLGDFEPGLISPTLHGFSGSAGTPFLAEVNKSGCAPIWISARLPEYKEAHLQVTAEPIPLAALTVQCAEPFEIEGMTTEQLQKLTPGPLHLTLRRAGGQRMAVQLLIEPGAQRVISWNWYPPPFLSPKSLPRARPCRGALWGRGWRSKRGDSGLRPLGCRN